MGVEINNGAGADQREYVGFEAANRKRPANSPCVSQAGTH